MAEQLLPGYWIRTGSRLDRALLLKFLQRGYADVFPGQDFSHLARTVEQYFSPETPLWWVEYAGGQGVGSEGVGSEGVGSKGDKEDKGDKGDKKEIAPLFPPSPLPPAPCPPSPLPPSPLPPASFLPSPIACLWAGNAIDQLRGDRHTHIFLIYVMPEHRRRGLGKALIKYVENWARNRGDRQIALQVFQSNQPAINLYNQLGYQTQSLWMIKSLHQEKDTGGWQ